MKKIVIVLLGMLFVSTANATLITFDDVTANSSTPFVSGGLSFSGITSYAWNTSGTSSDNGTQALIIGYGGNVTITKDGGGLFSIDSLDAGLSWYTALSSFDVNIGSETITLGTGYSAYSFTSLTNISSLTIASAPNDGYIAIDNISWSDASAVPEPGSLALLALGLAGVGFSRKKKTA